MQIPRPGSRPKKSIMSGSQAPETCILNKVRKVCGGWVLKSDRHTTYPWPHLPSRASPTTSPHSSALHAPLSPSPQNQHRRMPSLGPSTDAGENPISMVGRPQQFQRKPDPHPFYPPVSLAAVFQSQFRSQFSPQSARVVLRKDPGLGSLNNRNLLLTVLKAESPRSR